MRYLSGANVIKNIMRPRNPHVLNETIVEEMIRFGKAELGEAKSKHSSNKNDGYFRKTCLCFASKKRSVHSWFVSEILYSASPKLPHIRFKQNTAYSPCILSLIIYTFGDKNYERLQDGKHKEAYRLSSAKKRVRGFGLHRHMRLPKREKVLAASATGRFDSPRHSRDIRQTLFFASSRRRLMSEYRGDSKSDRPKFLMANRPHRHHFFKYSRPVNAGCGPP